MVEFFFCFSTVGRGGVHVKQRGQDIDESLLTKWGMRVRGGRGDKGDREGGNGGLMETEKEKRDI